MKKRAFTMDALFPNRSPSVENAGAEALQSNLIDAYENALLQGMAPLDALAVVLDWVSSEITRVGISQDKETR
jgi:hypothetical protein